MYHYIVNVPSGGEALIAKDTIIDRIEYFNCRSHYLGGAAVPGLVLWSDSRHSFFVRFLFCSQ